MATPAVVPPRNRRLGGLKNNAVIGKPKPPPTAPPKITCCDSPNIEDDGEGHKVCTNCYTQISDANIVSEVTFSEDSRGAAAVQGGFINEHARHANTLGSAITRATGGGERNSAQEIERNARRSLDKLCPKLGIPENTRNQAVSLFSLASGAGFSAGRRTDEVAAACLYAACRRQRDNQVMLIDISELLHMNVFRLGEVYKDMCKDMHVKDKGGTGLQYLVEVESLIIKYCRKLEFGEHTRQVAEDAVKIVRRMKRDWMVTGRHPAGLCGACIILAAKMNNFRRSTREVVWVAKVADVTIKKRVEEFRRTKAAALTVEQFREYGVRLKQQADPPVLYERQLKDMKFNALKRKRQEASVARELENGSVPPDGAANGASATPGTEGDDSQGSPKRPRTETNHRPTPPDTQQELRRDADGFLIPAVPATQQQASTSTDQAADGAQANGQDQEVEPPKRKRGRPKKQPPKPIIITEEELADEEQLEMDINDNLNDEEVLDSVNELEQAKAEERARQLADLEKQAAAEKSRQRREAEGMTWMRATPAPTLEIFTPEDLEAEFADDPEVQNCLLSDAEQKVKEQIWVHHNEDWLRQQQEKQMLAEFNKAAGRTPQGRKPGAKAVKRKRRSKMGDGTTLAEANTPIETPADANRAMVEKRGAQFSKFINWELLNKVYEPDRSSRTTSTRASSTTPGASRGATPSASSRAAAEDRGSATPSPPASEASAVPSPARNRQAVPGAAVAEQTRESASPEAAEPEAPQAQAAEEDMDIESDPDDYVQDDEVDVGADDELDYGFDAEDDGGDYEDDYGRALDSTGRVAMSGDYMDDEYD